MISLLTKVCFPLLVLQTFIGTVANGSIVFITFVDWFRRQKLSPMDLILTCLGLSRLFLQAVTILDVALFSLLKNTLGNVVFTVIGVWIFTNSVNICFAACLSFFYLAKIAIFSHPVFLHIKQCISGLLPWLLLGSVVSSAAQTIIVMTSWSYDESACNPHKPLSSNWSNAKSSAPQMCRHTFALLAVFDFIPFVVFLLSSIFLLSSLWKHMRRVQCNGFGTRDLNTQAHLSAIKTLASFAVLYLISFAAFTAFSVMMLKNDYTWTLVTMTVSSVYPTGHAIILILINPKLKQSWLKVATALKKWFKV